MKNRIWAKRPKIQPKNRNSVSILSSLQHVKQQKRKKLKKQTKRERERRWELRERFRERRRERSGEVHGDGEVYWKSQLTCSFLLSSFLLRFFYRFGLLLHCCCWIRFWFEGLGVVLLTVPMMVETVELRVEIQWCGDVCVKRDGVCGGWGNPVVWVWITVDLDWWRKGGWNQLVW